MNTRFGMGLGALLIGVIAASCSRKPDEPIAANGDNQAKQQQDSGLLQVAVVTGGHAFDVPNFHRLFRRLPSIDAYPQHLEHFASSPEEVRDSYDVVVFYGMDREIPLEEGPHFAGRPREAIMRIAERGQGIVVMHHALLAWEKWDFWNQLVGFDNRNFRYKEGLQLDIKVSDHDHPVTRNTTDFRTEDEGYILHGKYDGKGSVLLTVDHESAMEQVAWARENGNCRTVCLALGHDNQAWLNPAFQNFLQSSIAWAARRDLP